MKSNFELLNCNMSFFIFLSDLSHIVDLSMLHRITMLLVMMTKSQMVSMICMGS